MTTTTQAAHTASKNPRATTNTRKVLCSLRRPHDRITSSESCYYHVLVIVVGVLSSSVLRSFIRLTRCVGIFTFFSIALFTYSGLLHMIDRIVCQATSSSSNRLSIRILRAIHINTAHIQRMFSAARFGCVEHFALIPFIFLFVLTHHSRFATTNLTMRYICMPCYVLRI